MADFRSVLLTLLLQCVCVLSLDNGLGLVPPMGWNSWCTLGTCGRNYCDADEVTSIADAMESYGMRELGYEYINLDSCWADSRALDGTIVANSTRFPSGIKKLVNMVNDRGFKFGLYTDGGVYNCGNRSRSHPIPGSYGHYEQDAQTYADWGVEFVKMDWCNTTGLDPKVQYAQMSKALNMTGRPIFFSACEWGVEDPWEWMAAFANSWRSGPDHHDNWESTAFIIEKNADLGKYSGPGGWNDADLLMTGGPGCENDTNPLAHCPGMTDLEYRTEFTMWCIMGSPLIITTDIRNMTDIMKEVLLNKDLIAVNQDPLGKGGNKIGTSNCTQGAKYCQIWAKQLTGGAVAVALYNSGEEESVIEIQLSMVDLSPPVAVLDLWSKESFILLADTYSRNVEPHEAKAFKMVHL